MPLAVRTYCFALLTFASGEVNLSAHGDVHEQIEEMGKLLQTNPADSTARLTRASCYFAHGQYAESLEDLGKLPPAEAGQKGPALLRIRASLKIFRLQEGEQLIAAYLAANPGDYDALRERAHLRIAQERFPEAITDLDSVIAATPAADPDLLLARARVTAKMDLSKALAWIDQKLLSTPLVVLEDEAISLCQKANRPKEAAERLLKMAVKLPRPEFCHGRRGKLLAEAGLPQESLQAWQDCLAALDKLPPHTRSQPAVAELRKAAENALKPSP